MSNWLTRIHRRIRKTAFTFNEGSGVKLPTSGEEWRRWSKPRRRWFISIGVFAVLGFILAALHAPTWSLITTFAVAFLSQAPVLYYEWREDHRGTRESERPD